jgi:CHAD domain-containing protein
MARRSSPTWPSRLAAFLEPRGRGREEVHRLHRDLRRSRFEGQILGRVLGAPSSDRSLERPKELRELEKALGAWRDVEMTRDLWRELGRGEPPPPELRWRGTWERSFDAEARGYERASIRLARALLRRSDGPPSPPAAPGVLRRLEAPVRWRRELETRRRRYLKALRRIDGRLPAEPAHAFRQELRRLGVFYDLLSAAPWASPPRRPAKVQRVIDRLGRVHDIDRALVRLAREEAGPARDDLGRRLRAERRRAADRARRALESKSVRRFAEGGVRRKK